MSTTIREWISCADSSSLKPPRTSQPCEEAVAGRERTSTFVASGEDPRDKSVARQLKTRSLESLSRGPSRDRYSRDSLGTNPSGSWPNWQAPECARIGEETGGVGENKYFGTAIKIDMVMFLHARRRATSENFRYKYVQHISAETRTREEAAKPRSLSRCWFNESAPRRPAISVILISRLL